MSLPSTSSLPTSENIKPVHSSSSSSLEDSSDEDLFTVPDVESGPSSSAGKGETEAQQSTASRKERNRADREYRKHKRLLRNRVSAQQARERKKIYVNDMESRAKKLHDNNLILEEKISTLINENTMLRKVLMSTRPKDDQNVQNDKSGNN